MNRYFKSAKIEKAEQIISEIIQNCSELSHHFFIKVIRGYARNNDPKNAHKWFDRTLELFQPTNYGENLSYS